MNVLMALVGSLCLVIAAGDLYMGRAVSELAIFLAVYGFLGATAAVLGIMAYRRVQWGETRAAARFALASSLVAAVSVLTMAGAVLIWSSQDDVRNRMATKLVRGIRKIVASGRAWREG